jgi:serine/threonine protein kinase
MNRVIGGVMDRYRFSGKIEGGAYGVVYKARDSKRNEDVALKKMRLNIDDEGIPQCALREFAFLKVLQGTNHANIVRLLDITIEAGKLYLAFELMECDLKKLMDLSHTQGLSPDLVRSYTTQIFEGLAFIHSMGVMHRYVLFRSIYAPHLTNKSTGI